MHRLFDHLDALIDVVIAGDGGDDLDVGARHAVLEAADALFEVESAGDAGQQGHLAAVGQSLLHQVSGSLTALVVVHSQVGEAAAVGRVRIPGHHRDAGLLGFLDGINTSGGIVAGDADGLDPGGNGIFDDPGLLSRVGSHRGGVHDFDLIGTFFGQFFGLGLRPNPAHFKDGIIQRLGNPGNSDLAVF